MKPGGRKTLDLVARWMRLSMVLFFMEIRGNEMQPKDWVMLAQAGLVVSVERRYLERLIPPQRSVVLLYWMASATISGYAATNCVGKGPPVLCGFIARLTDFDDAQWDVHELITMPVPFPYFHLTQMTVIISLALWAYGMAIALSPLSTLMYALLLLSTVGITELANSFTAPYGGHDDTHFPLHIWFRMFRQNQDFLLRCSSPRGLPQSRLEEPKAEMPVSTTPPAVGEPAAPPRALTMSHRPLSPLDSGEVLLRYDTYCKEFIITEGRITAREIDKQYALSTIMPRCRIRLSALGPGEKQSLAAAGVPFAYVQEQPQGTFHGLLAGHEYFVYADQDDAATAGHITVSHVQITVGQNHSCSCDSHGHSHGQVRPLDNVEETSAPTNHDDPQPQHFQPGSTPPPGHPHSRSVPLWQRPTTGAVCMHEH